MIKMYFWATKYKTPHRRTSEIQTRLPGHKKKQKIGRDREVEAEEEKHHLHPLHIGDHLAIWFLQRTGGWGSRRIISGRFLLLVKV